MAKEMVISANRHETKLAILEDDQLVEIIFQRSHEYSLAGSIHKGRVTRVLPGMQSAFVNLGLERDTFLYVTDFFEENDEFDKVSAPEDRSPRREPPPTTPEPVVAATPVFAEPVPGPQAVAMATATAPADPRDRDRRNRRSRRRRGRGRGFPESKYAAPPPPAEPAAPIPDGGVSEEAPADVFVLPGESLAKYAREDEPELASPREEEEVEYPNGDDEPIVLESTAAGVEIEPGPPEAEEPPPAVVEITSAPVKSAIEDERLAEEPVASEEVIELRDIAEAALEASEEEEEEAAEASEEEPVEELQAGESPASTAPLSAEVRDRDFAPRYLQRPSRRMRRKMRGGTPGERDTRPREERPREDRKDERVPREQTSITELLKEGQEILVQVAKEPMGQKGARITSHIALPGRYCVYMPTVEHLGVSRKISTEEERQRLKRILLRHREGIPGGFIMRTAGEGKSEADIAADMNFLYQLWMDIRAKAERSAAPALIHHDLDVVQRMMRDQLSDNFKAVWVDDEETYESTVSFVGRFQPGLVSRVKLYTRDAPIFDAFGITQELEKALRPKVWLKSGGYIVINQTEALVAIDVNTGKFVGKSNRLEDTIVKTNTEAVREIVRQVRLRDLGGIIVVDFIDMDERKNRQKVMQTLEEAMRSDRAPYKILQFNDFGLVAITRKRVKQSLERALCAPCPHCEGSGYVKSVQTVIGEILVEARKIANALDSKEVVLRVHPDIAKILKSSSNHHLEEIEEILKRPVLVTGDPLLHHEKFDLA